MPNIKPSSRDGHDQMWANAWGNRLATAHHHNNSPSPTDPPTKTLSHKVSYAERLREYLGLRIQTASERWNLTRLLRKRASSADVPHGESFIPCTKLTFFADRDSPGSLTCALCHDTHLVVMGVDYGRGSNGEARQMSSKYATRGPCTSDSVPSFLPCGHVGGSECLNLWLDEHDSCPFCRVGLRYPKCGHKIRPRPAADWRDLHMLPATVPEGGSIPDKCTDCFQAELEADFHAKWVRTLQEYKHDEARAIRLEKRGVVRHWERVQERKDVLDNLYSAEVMEPLGRRWAQRTW